MVLTIYALIVRSRTEMRHKHFKRLALNCVHLVAVGVLLIAALVTSLKATVQIQVKCPLDVKMREMIEARHAAENFVVTCSQQKAGEWLNSSLKFSPRD